MREALVWIKPMLSMKKLPQELDKKTISWDKTDRKPRPPRLEKKEDKTEENK